MLVARYREMRAGRPLAGLRASAAAVRPLPSPHHSWALPDTPPSHPSRLHPHPLRLPASEKRAKAAMGAGRVSVPLSGPRQSDARTAAADDAPSPSRRCATPGSPSTPVLGAAGGQVLGAFDGEILQTGISARKPPPPRRSYAAGSRRSAWFGGRYGRWGS